MNKILSAMFALSLICPASVRAQDLDIIIRNGRIADGTGNPAYLADIGIRDGKIAAIGRLRGPAARELDARGHIVAPGFIDVHTHAEGITSQPLSENFVRMGVTTLVLGNCGGSKLDIAEGFKEIEALTVSANVATLIGHNTVRKTAMGGSFMRPPTDEELEHMKSLVEKAMQDGAVGLSTGLIYLPGTFAKTEEIIELARVAAAYDGIYVSHMRNEGDRIGEAIEELCRIAREAETRAEISHIKLAGKANWGRTDDVLALIEKARAEGLDITHDQYAYTASSTSISQLIPQEAREGDQFKARLADPGEKAKVVEGMKAGLRRRGNEDYAFAVIASYRADRSLNGLNIVEAARKKYGADSLDDQIEMILETAANGGASGVFHGMSEPDLQAFLQHPNTMIAADSGMRRFGEGVPHPRGYGNNARVLGRYVRELKVLRIEDAVRKMSLLPATVFRLKDRGQIREGAWADIVVFDPETVTDNATFSEPHQYSTGFKYVLVNGVPVVEGDTHTGARPGQVVRHGGVR